MNNDSTKQTWECAKCGKTLHVKPHHIEGIGDLGPKCYANVAGLEALIEDKFNKPLTAAEWAIAKHHFELMGIKYKKQTILINGEYQYILSFAGFNRASSKCKVKKYAYLTFAQIRESFKAQLQAASQKRREVAA